MRREGLGPLSKLLTAAAGLFFVLAITLAFFLTRGEKTGPPVEVVIPSGMPLNKVVTLLHGEKIITEPQFFKVLLRATQGASRVRAGEYRFHRYMRPLDTLRTLYFDPPITHQVTIPEGWTIKQIGQILEDANLADADSFAALALSKESARRYNLSTPSLEGFLFPDTYSFSKTDSEEVILNTMVKRAMQKLAQYKEEAKLKGFDLEKLVNLAAIVEKETGAPEERPIIASVYLNRLRIGKRLESDPTTIYGIKDFDGNLTRKHLRTKTAYNTYKMKGLPLGPIANPGEKAIIAVLRPAKTDYLYFVAMNNGTHKFSKTYAEHAKAVDIYQRRRRRGPQRNKANQ